MGAPTRIEIIDQALEYLKRGDCNGAIRYLETVRASVLEEAKSNKKKRSKSTAEKCLEMLENNDEFRALIERKLMEMEEKLHDEIRRIIEEELKKTMSAENKYETPLEVLKNTEQTT